MKKKTRKSTKSKRKSTPQVPQYFLGGALKKMLAPAAGAAASFIPGVGPAIAPFVAHGVGALTAEEQEQEIQRQQTRKGSTMGYQNGGAMNFMGQNAFNFTGPSHEGGGIQLPNAEVEGGETMDFVEFRNGGMMDTRNGSPYIFSKRLKVPETNTSFADTHKRLVKNNASEDEIKQLAMQQEKLTGRNQEPNNEMANGGKMSYQNGGTPPWWRGVDFFTNPQGQTISTKNPPKIPKTPKLGPGTGSKLPIPRPPAGPTAVGKPLNTIYRNFIPRNLGAIGVGAWAGKEIGEAVAGEELSDAWGNWRDAKGNLAEATANREFEEDKLQSLRGLYDKFPEQGRPRVGAQAPTDEVIEPDPLNIPQGDMNLGAPLEVPQAGAQENTAIPPANPVTRAEVPAADFSANYSGEDETVASAPAPAPVMAEQQTGDESGGGMSQGMSSALQFVPEAMNFLTGAFGKNDTPEATQVSNRSVEMMDPTVNVNPQLLRNASSYRAILRDPNATPTQKMAAQSQKMQADSAVFADKMNRENKMKANQASLQANIDSQNAQYSNQTRSENMKADAMFGPFGNMARGAASSAAQKLLMQQAQRNQKSQNDMSAMAIISQLDPALQEKFAKQLGIFE